MRILVVEDDEIIGERLKQSLSKEGYKVDWALDGKEGLDLAAIENFGLVILDIMLPGMDGIQVCTKLRSLKNPVPILMLTARDQTSDKIKGLDVGADDYLAKPFDFGELLARVRALLRREGSAKSSLLEIADIALDSIHQTAKRNGELLHLTPREFSLLEALMRNQGRVLTRERIIESIWGDDESLSNTVNFHVTSLRKKIDAGREKSLIETVHGFGYSIRSQT